MNQTGLKEPGFENRRMFRSKAITRTIALSLKFALIIRVKRALAGLGKLIVVLVLE